VSLSASISSPRDHLEAGRRALLLQRFGEVRAASERLCASLDPEDLVAQSMPDCSPLKWHLAHTTWFFEAMVLAPFAPPGEPYTPFHPRFGFLFNSYYNAIGERHQRPQRGVLTRPYAREVAAYRRAVDEAVQRLLEREALPRRDEALRIVELGLQHEQQHQELMLTDLKHLFSLNALEPAYRPPLEVSPNAPPSQGWIDFDAGVCEIGHAGAGFAFDNEMPRHRVFVEAFSLADRLVTNADYRAFVDDGGYRDPARWLDAGWAVVQREAWERPLYWRETPDGLAEFTLAGLRELTPAEPVCHLSYVEADAFARWAGARLPSEAEWECAAAGLAVEGNFVGTGWLHPAPAHSEAGRLAQMFGDVWEWTSSAYSPYPGYRPEVGALGEYNGKFMCDQLVLRGGSCASSQDHLRATYRNFFRSPDRWQFSGLRLARDR
jgi:ergothioneine biosynthesis protein EgtB